MYTDSMSKKSGGAIPPDKVNFKTKIIIRDKERQFIMKNWPIHEEEITINMHHLKTELPDT